jgi:hypothetical protein
MGFLARISAGADHLLARSRSALGDLMPVYFFCAVYFLTVVLGNLIYLTPRGLELARTVGAHNDAAALRYVAAPAYWLLLILPFLVVPAAATVGRRAAAGVLSTKLSAAALGELGIPTYVICSALIHAYCIYIVSSQGILALNATPADAASSVELRYMILAKVGFGYRVLANSILPFLVVYAALAAARTRRVEWWALYCGNALLNSLYLILLNMKWPVLVFWLVNLIALFYVANRRLFVKLTAVSAIYVVCYLGVSAFVLGFEARVFRSSIVAEIPPSSELQLVPESHLLGPAAPGVRLTVRDQALEIQTIPTEGYQIGSAFIRSIPGAGYRVRYAIDVSTGDVAVGVFDADSNRWVTVKPVTDPTGELAFVARSERFRIILINTPRPIIAVATARVHGLSVSPMPADLAAQAERLWRPDETPPAKPDAGPKQAGAPAPLGSGSIAPARIGSPEPAETVARHPAAPVSDAREVAAKTQDRPRADRDVAGPAGPVAATIESGLDRGSRFGLALVNRMAIAVPFYYAEFSEKGWVCGTVWDRLMRKPSPCSPAVYIYNRMFEGDAFQNRGTATAAVNISGYALGGWPAAIIATSLAGCLLGAFAAFGRDWSASPLRASIWIMGVQVAYFLTQLPIEGAIVYDHGAMWWGGLVLIVACAAVAGRQLRRVRIATLRSGAAR